MTHRLMTLAGLTLLTALGGCASMTPEQQTAVSLAEKTAVPIAARRYVAAGKDPIKRAEQVLVVAEALQQAAQAPDLATFSIAKAQEAAYQAIDSQEKLSAIDKADLKSLVDLAIVVVPLFVPTGSNVALPQTTADALLAVSADLAAAVLPYLPVGGI